jgi:hypothetical protein
VCVLFGGKSNWTVTGIRNLKHLSVRVKKHEACAAHTENYVKFNLFGSVNTLLQLNEGYRVSIQRHHELVDKNRHILGKIINSIKLCETQKLPLRGHDETETSYNREIFLDLVSELARLSSVLDEHLCSATESEKTLKTIQNKLLDCMNEVYKQTLTKEIQNANFVSIQGDKTTDISFISQFVILLRYVKRDGPVERFHSFVQVQNVTANVWRQL